MAEAPILIPNDPTEIVAEMKAEYETLTGKTLPAGSPEMLLINMFAARLSTHIASIQSAGLQMLVAFATAPMLDYLAELVGVVRLAPQAAQCNILLTLTAGHTQTIIPAGMRIQTADGRVVFEITEDVLVLDGVTTANVSAICQTTGVIGNGYAIGEVSDILDPQPFLVSASNTNITVAGSDQETDEQLRERIKLAPSAFSTAGPKDAYIYFAKTASPLIIDVAVTMPTPGTVNVYPLVEDAASGTPQEILDLVTAILTDEKVRPLTDTVAVLSPTKVGYQLKVNITKITGAVNQDILDVVTPKVEAFVKAASMKIGRNVTATKIKSLCMYDDTQVYDVTLLDENNDPFVDKIITDTQFAFCDTLTIAITGSNAG
ncbi:MAG TPA: baseplate J/gp47 family protein [Flavobacteriales bacterium]|nr:baseplate J/gp47 family protein [Flavobacteriales bacterium]